MRRWRWWLKWLASGLTLLVCIGWLLSLRYACSVLRPQWRAVLHDGAIRGVYTFAARPQLSRTIVERRAPIDFGLRWPHLRTFKTTAAVNDIWVADLPLWLPGTASCALAVWGWRRDRPPRAGHCPDCGYDLRVTAGQRCPECGRPFERS